MGLTLSRGAWQSSYGEFNDYRRHVARMRGIADLNGVVAYFADALPSEVFMGDWSGTEAVMDPLLYLFPHSDCEGVLYPEQAAPLADRLDELLPEMANDLNLALYRRDTEMLVAGLRRAVDAGEPVEFC